MSADPAPPPAEPTRGFRRWLPNAITVSRLFLAAVFFAMLALHRHEPGVISWWLFAAGWVYGLAAATDFLDGYLARRWRVVSVFGRVVDPFCDKILILGSFAFFATHPFIAYQDGEGGGGVGRFVSLTGVGPVVVILLLSRELLVTTLRSLAESSGQSAAANWAGKAKMIFQSVAVPTILALVVFRPVLWDGGTLEFAAKVVQVLAVWGTVLATLVSGLAYLPRRSD